MIERQSRTRRLQASLGKGGMGEVLTKFLVLELAMSRPFVIEPDIVARFKSGNQSESRCINCGFCLLGTAGHSLKCYHGRIPKDKKTASLTMHAHARLLGLN